MTVVIGSASTGSGTFSTLDRGLTEADGQVAVIFVRQETRPRFDRRGRELAGG